MAAGNDVIVARAVARRYGGVRALEGLELRVARGTTHVLLGPNGAGKTTAVRILSTLLRPDAGHASVAGFDVVRDRRRVRACLGVVGQDHCVDGQLTGRENLRLVGRLCQLSRAQARARADELLEQFGLTAAADRRSDTYSGGMRRRLDLAAGLVHRPEVLILDEPTTGLDPSSRREVWTLFDAAVATGATILLTTQDLVEAERLADDVTVLHRGRVVETGRADALKHRFGRTIVTSTYRGAGDARAALAPVHQRGWTGATVTGCDLSIPVASTAEALFRLMRVLEEGEVVPERVSVREPTLDDVVAALTGDTDVDRVAS